MISGERSGLVILSVKLFTLVGLMQGLKVISICVYRKDLELKNKELNTNSKCKCLKVLNVLISIGGKKKTEAVVSEILADDGSIEQVHSPIIG